MSKRPQGARSEAKPSEVERMPPRPPGLRPGFIEPVWQEPALWRRHAFFLG
jgi:hypothetical protein